MANTRALTIFILFFVFFNTLIGLFSIDTGSEETDISKYFVFSNFREKLEQNENFFSSVVSVVLIPFVLIDGIITLFALMGHGFVVLPNLVKVFFITPLSIIIFYQYILPYLRGN